MGKGDDRLVIPGVPAVEVTLRRSDRARRISLRVSRIDGRVTLSLPRRTALDEANAFLQEKVDWVRGHLASRPEPLTPLLGTTVPVEAVSRPVMAAEPGARPRFEDGVLLVAPDRPVPPQVAACLKGLARQRLQASCERHADTLGRRPSRIDLRDTRSRWGSCNRAGRLMFSWRLVMAPPAVLDYVAAHEMAHLVELNHSPAFWRVVDRLRPDWRDHRAWLNDAGAELHRIRFD